MRIKAERKVCKEKTAKIFEISEKAKLAIEDGEKEKDAIISDTEIEVDGEKWAQHLTEESFVEFRLQNTDLTQVC